MLRGLIVLKTEKEMRYFVFLKTQNTFFIHEMLHLLYFLLLLFEKFFIKFS